MGRITVRLNQSMSRARLERHIDAAHQLRAETVASRIRLSDPLVGIRFLLRRIAAVIADLMPRRA